MTSRHVVKRPAATRLNSCIWSLWYGSLPRWGWRKSQGCFRGMAERRFMRDHIEWNHNRLLTLDRPLKVQIISISWLTGIQTHSSSTQPLCFKMSLNENARGRLNTHCLFIQMCPRCALSGWRHGHCHQGDISLAWKCCSTDSTVYAHLLRHCF